MRVTPKIMLTTSGALYGKPDVVARRVSENRPPANVRNFRFGNHRFPSMRLYGCQGGVDVVGREIDQQSVWLIGRLRGLRKPSTKAALGLEYGIVVFHIGFNLPAKHIMIECAC